MNTIQDKIQIIQMEINVESNLERKKEMQKQLQKLLLKKEIETIRRKIEQLG